MKARSAALTIVIAAVAMAVGCILSGINNQQLQRPPEDGLAAPCTPIAHFLKSEQEPKSRCYPDSYIAPARLPLHGAGGNQNHDRICLNEEDRKALREFSPLHRRPPPQAS